MRVGLGWEGDWGGVRTPSEPCTGTLEQDADTSRLVSAQWAKSRWEENQRWRAESEGGLQRPSAICSSIRELVWTRAYSQTHEGISFTQLLLELWTGSVSSSSNTSVISNTGLYSGNRCLSFSRSNDDSCAVKQLPKRRNPLVMLQTQFWIVIKFRRSLDWIEKLNHFDKWKAVTSVCASLFKWNQQFHVRSDQQCDTNEKVELLAVWADWSPSVNCCGWGDPEEA